MAYAALLDSLQEDILRHRAPSPAFRPHPRLTARQQLAIYADGYRTRLEKVVTNSYPATCQLLGKETFVRQARDFIEATPSRHFNIDRYALGFAGFIAPNAPVPAAELARLEAAVAEIFLLEDSDPLTPDMLTGMDEEAFAAMPLRLRKAARLLQTEYAVNDYLTAFRKSPPPLEGGGREGGRSAGSGLSICPPHLTSPLKGGRDEAAPGLTGEEIEKQTQYLLIYRHQRQVRRVAMEQKAFRLLSLLAEGRTLAQAIEGLADEIIAPEWLQGRFHEWLAKGVLRNYV